MYFSAIYFILKLFLLNPRNYQMVSKYKDMEESLEIIKISALDEQVLNYLHFIMSITFVIVTVLVVWCFGFLHDKTFIKDNVNANKYVKRCFFILLLLFWYFTFMDLFTVMTDPTLIMKLIDLI